MSLATVLETKMEEKLGSGKEARIKVIKSERQALRVEH